MQVTKNFYALKEKKNIYIHISLPWKISAILTLHYKDSGLKLYLQQAFFNLVKKDVSSGYKDPLGVFPVKL